MKLTPQGSAFLFNTKVSFTPNPKESLNFYDIPLGNCCESKFDAAYLRIKVVDRTRFYFLTPSFLLSNR